MSSEVDANHYEVTNEIVRANGGWITNEFLQDVISHQWKDEEVRVVGSEATAAVGLGDNYMSIMYQMTAELEDVKTGRREQRRFLIKGLPSAKIPKMIVEEYGFFRKELYMYNVCLPAMRRIMEEHMPDETDFIAAESYCCNLPNVLVLEDLKLSGYKMGQRREQLDFDHSATSLRTMARFHALSMRLVEAKPEVVDELSKEELYSDEKSNMHTHIAAAVKSWLEIMGEQEATERFVPVMTKVTKNIMNKITHVVKSREGSYLAVNHGDSWTNNFMYKYDENGKVVHAKLVDFQIARYACPVLDILYFLFSSPQPDMLAENFTELIRIYQEALVSDMEKLGIERSRFPTLEDVLGEMRFRGIMGIVAVITITPVIISKPSDTMDFENITLEQIEQSEEFPMANNFRDSYYQQLVCKYMGILEKMGYLEAAQDLLADVRTESESVPE